MFAIPTVLFICTGNIYRSRFAEALFNHHAQAEGLGWCAFSRGLRTESISSEGLSPHAQAALEARNIEVHHTATTKSSLTAEDLEMAHIIIALSAAEHRPLLAEQFPAWLDQFNFWEVGDLPLSSPEAALSLIEHEVLNLLQELKAVAEDPSPDAAPTDS
ncbi:MAG: low molecular weight phosphatase family protein [Verrucomicrobia bacterium]|nr:low molecular weight phosphatase family protein [Verrucomicrobiota bacterium]MDA1006048.1 low molecular weight phosphatase family protein [Verrucomicrobiota bacterium]